MADLAQRLRAALDVEDGVSDDALIQYVTETFVYAAQADQRDSDDDGEEDEGEEDDAPATTQPTPQTPPAPVVPVAPTSVAASESDLATEVRQLRATLGTVTSELASIKAEKAETAKDRVLASAIDDGKITIAARDEWSKNYDEAPEVTTRVLASMAPGTAMPVRASGHSGTNEAIGTDEQALDAEFRGIAGLPGGDV